jgi:hypothetical protein
LLGLNFKEALATLARALPAFFLRAGFYVVGGFIIILLFGMGLFTLRLMGGAGPALATLVVTLPLLGGWLLLWLGQRFFLFRQQAVLLGLFSGSRPPDAAADAARRFLGQASWTALNRRIRRALRLFNRQGGGLPVPPLPSSRGLFSNSVDFLAAGILGQAVISLSFSRKGEDAGKAAQEGLALNFRYGVRSRSLARSWQGFSLASLALLFLCLAAANWLFFRAAGVPPAIGIVLAAAIAWLLHRAFVEPLVLAGVSASLLAETREHTPDTALCEKIASLLTP